MADIRGPAWQTLMVLDTINSKNVFVYKTALIHHINENKTLKRLRNYYCRWDKYAYRTCLKWPSFIKAANQAGLTNKFHLKMCRELDYNKSVKLNEI